MNRRTRNTVIALIVVFDILALVTLAVGGILESMTSVLFCDNPGVTADECWNAGKWLFLSRAKFHIAAFVVINLIAALIVFWPQAIALIRRRRN